MVRVAFAVGALAGGTGIVAYMVAWPLLAGRPETKRRPVTLRHQLGVVVGTAAFLAMVQGWGFSAGRTLPWVVAAVGFALALVEPDPAGPSDRTGIAGSGSRGRVVAGLVLMSAGMVGGLTAWQDVSGLVRALPAALALVGGLALVLTPWARGLLADAAASRQEQARAEARADMAAHLHDSVLQTLTIIQNRAGQPEVAAALAHQQERELRRWLYGAERDPAALGSSFRAELEAAAAEVEDQYLKIVEVVVVGDTTLTPELASLVAAAREAMVNAAKFAEIAMISVYAEVLCSDDGSPRVQVFVRDRGIGFDVATVPPDRRGISDSIRGRVDRTGGASTIRSAPGRGTEVVLEWPR